MPHNRHVSFGWEDLFMVTLCYLLPTIIGLWLFFFAFVSVRAEESCLSKGYPEYRVTWNYNAYCLDLEGMVTTKVDKL